MCLKERRTLFLFKNVTGMKKTILYSLLAILVFSLCSCVEKKKSREQQVDEFRSELTEEDTAAMLKLCDDAMAQLKAKDYNAVLANLHEYTDSTQEVKPLTEETRQRYLNKFKMFPVLDYTRVYYSFQLQGCNDVKYDVTFATAKQAGTAEPAKTAYMFNPVKVDGTWKLCVKTATDEIDMNMR